MLVFVFANAIPNIRIHIHIHITKSDQQNTVPLQKIVLNFFHYDLYITKIYDSLIVQYFCWWFLCERQ